MRGRPTPRRVFWASWAAFMLLASVWVVSNPLMASPDEPAHVVKAASVVRGQLVGPQTTGGSEVQVPYFYQLVTAYPVCYMFHPEDTGVCEPQAAQPLDEEARSVTPAGRYNPLYYAVVGLPTLLPAGDGVLYAMRLVSAALCTFLLALGMRAVAEAPRPAWIVPGVAAALTPMVIFLTSTVNPAAVEIAAAFALWCQLLTLLHHRDPARTAQRMALIAVSTTLLVNARGLSLLYCAVIVGVVLLTAPWRTFVDVIRTRSTWPSFAVIVAACLAAVGWVLGAGSLGSGGEVTNPGLTFLGAAKATVLSTNNYVTNMLGQFGWMDTNLENWVQMTFAAGVGAVILLALAVGTWRERAAIVLVAALTFVLPILIHASQARYLGLIWQGRYILPIALGVPLLAGYVLARRLGTLPAEVAVAFATVVAGLLAVVQLIALGENLHRYVNGEDGGWLSLAPDAWLPPLPLGLVVILGLVAAAGYGVLLAWTARQAPSPAEAPSPVAAPSPAEVAE